MVEVIPGIIEATWPPIEQKLKNLSGLSEWVHLDVSDGLLTPNKTWAEPADLTGINYIKIELHLMTERPWEEPEEWFKPAVKRLVVHYEAFKRGRLSSERISNFFKEVKAAEREVVLAFSINTPWEEALDIISSVDGVMLMAITPGYSGQPFEPAVIKKIKKLREQNPSLIIEVDGGVKPNIVGSLIEAGASRFVSTSYTWASPSLAEALEEYKKQIAAYKK